VLEIRRGRTCGLFVAKPSPVVRLRHTLLTVGEQPSAVMDAIELWDHRENSLASGLPDAAHLRAAPSRGSAGCGFRRGRGKAHVPGGRRTEWCTWASPEFVQLDTGLRPEFQPREVRERAVALVEAALSLEG
jgi:hypothetical protein